MTNYYDPLGWVDPLASDQPKTFFAVVNNLTTKVQFVIKHPDTNQVKYVVFDFQGNASSIQLESPQYQKNLFLFVLGRRPEYEEYRLISYEWVPKTGFTKTAWKQIEEAEAHQRDQYLADPEYQAHQDWLWK